MQAKVGPGETASTQVANYRPSIPSQTQAKEADVQAIYELTRALDKKVKFLIHNSISILGVNNWKNVLYLKGNERLYLFNSCRCGYLRTELTDHVETCRKPWCLS